MHRVHAVVVRTGASCGGASALIVFLRSSAKPIQAIPLVEALRRPRRRRSRDRVRLAPGRAGAARRGADAARRARRHGGRLENGLQDGRPLRQGRAQLLGQARRHARRLRRQRLAVRGLPAAGSSAAGADRRARRDYARHRLDGCGVPTYAMSLEQMSLVADRATPGADRRRDARAAGARRRPRRRRHR